MFPTGYDNIIPESLIEIRCVNKIKNFDLFLKNKNFIFRHK